MEKKYYPVFKIINTFNEKRSFKFNELCDKKLLEEGLFNGESFRNLEEGFTYCVYKYSEKIGIKGDIKQKFDNIFTIENNSSECKILRDMLAKTYELKDNDRFRLQDVMEQEEWEKLSNEMLEKLKLNFEIIIQEEELALKNSHRGFEYWRVSRNNEKTI